MAQSRDAAEPNARLLADLSALADGSLDEERAESVRELIAQSPELRRRYDRERQAVTALQTLRTDRAPARVRIAIDRGRRPGDALPLPRASCRLCPQGRGRLSLRAG